MTVDAFCFPEVIFLIGLGIRKGLGVSFLPWGVDGDIPVVQQHFVAVLPS